MAYIEIFTNGAQYSVVCFICEITNNVEGEAAAVKLRADHVALHADYLPAWAVPEQGEKR